MQTNNKPIRRWHYRTGLISATLIILLTITGFILNHSDHWNLNQIPLPTWLTKLAYNIPQQVESIHWERFLLDLHAGRFFGELQFLFLDFSAFCLIFLSASGIYSYWKKKH